MKKVTIVGRNRYAIEELVTKHGFVLDDKDFDLVISYGGDGTLIKAEEFHPGVPKIMLKDSYICKKCPPFTNDEILEKVKAKNFSIEEMPKILVSVDGHEMEGLSDVVVHNKDPRHALRYRVTINGEVTHHEIIGDGIVVATPFGSTGYYRSITHGFFEAGIGLAFNNSIEPSDHMILQDDCVIELEVTRGPAIVYADNHEKMVDVATGAKIRIEKGKNKGKIVVVR